MPRGWTSGPNGEMLPVSTSARTVHIMKVATGEVEKRRGMARARPGAPMESDVLVEDDEAPEYPMYGPGLPPPGGWKNEQAP